MPSSRATAAYNRDESFGDYGYQQQEFKDGELVDVDDGDDSSDDFEGESDDYTTIPLMKNNRRE